MIKLGKLTDYAIAVMGQLAHEATANCSGSASGSSANSCSAHYLARQTQIPEPTVAKVLKSLSKGHLVMSVRGAAGGYSLAKPANEISICDIVTAVDGPIEIVTCVDGQSDNCEMWDHCPTKGGWTRINEAIKSALKDVKLSEMVTPPCSKEYNFEVRINADCA